LNRRIIVKGAFHDVECAVREDGSCPAGEFLDALKAGRWDLKRSRGPVDEQLGEYEWFVQAIRVWAQTGEPQYRDAVKALEDGIWEFRHGDIRLTFYDTDGKGDYTAKLPIRDHAHAEAPDSLFWQIPYFDRRIRLGHAFRKVSQKTLPSDLEAAKHIREEDLAHDRQNCQDPG